MGVARLLRADLAAGHLLPVGLEPGLDLRLLLGARAQLAGEALARAAVGDELGVEHLHAAADRALRDLERGGEAGGLRRERGVVREALALRGEPAAPLGPLPLRALGQLALGGQRGADLRAPRGDRRVVGRPAALLDHVRRVALRLQRLVAGARGGAGLAVGGVAPRVGLLDARAGAVDGGERGVLGLRGALDGADQLVATVALRQHAILAAGRNLAQLAGARRPDAAVAGDGDAVEGGVERVDVLDDPDAREQGGREPGGGALGRGGDVVAERLGARRGRGRRRALGALAPGGRHQRGAAVATRAVEQRRRLHEIGRDRRAQARPERSGQRELVARRRRSARPPARPRRPARPPAGAGTG